LSKGALRRPRDLFFHLSELSSLFLFFFLIVFLFLDIKAKKNKVVISKKIKTPDIRCGDESVEAVTD